MQISLIVKTTHFELTCICIGCIMMYKCSLFVSVSVEWQWLFLFSNAIKQNLILKFKKDFGKEFCWISCHSIEQIYGLREEKTLGINYAFRV